MGTNVRQNIVTNGLVLYLDAGNRMSYTSGSTTWRDLSGNNRSITLVNGPTFSSLNQGSIAFDGVNDYGTGSAITGLGSSDRTINIWVKANTAATLDRGRIFTLATDESSTDTPAFVFGLDSSTPSGSVSFGGSPYDGGLTLNMITGSWFNICTTITSTKTITAYQNAVYINSRTATGAVGANPIPELARYNNTYGQWSNNNTAIIQIYNRILSPQEVAQNYNALKTRFGLR